MARVAIDADVVIAFLDAADPQHDAAVDLLGARLAAGDELLIAATVYAEVIVRPLALGTDGKVDEFLAAVGMRLVDISRAVARQAAALRGRHPALKLPDALSLATAIAERAELLTLDHRLRRIAEHEA